MPNGKQRIVLYHHAPFLKTSENNTMYIIDNNVTPIIGVFSSCFLKRLNDINTKIYKAKVANINHVLLPILVHAVNESNISIIE